MSKAMIKEAPATAEGRDTEGISRAENIAILETDLESVTEVASPAIEEVQQPVVEELKVAEEQQTPLAEEPTPTLEQVVTEVSVPISEMPSLMLEETPAETSVEHTAALEESVTSTSPTIEAQTPTIELPTISEVGPTLGAEEHSAEKIDAKEEEAASLTVGDSDISDIRALSIDAIPGVEITATQEPITGTVAPVAEDTPDDEIPRADEFPTDSPPIQQLVEEPMTEAEPVSVNVELSTPEEYEPQQSLTEGEAVQECTIEAVAMPLMGELPSELLSVEPMTEAVIISEPDTRGDVEEGTTEAVAMPRTGELFTEVPPMEPINEAVTSAKPDTHEPSIEECAVEEPTTEGVAMSQMDEISAEESPVQQGIVEPVTEVEPVVVSSIAAEESLVQVVSSEELDLQVLSTEGAVEEHTPESVAISSIAAEESPVQVVSSEELDLQAPSAEGTIEEHTPEPVAEPSVVTEESPVQVLSIEELDLHAPSTEEAVEECIPIPMTVSLTDEISAEELAIQQVLEPTTEAATPQETSQEPSELPVEDRVVEHIPQVVTAFDVDAPAMPPMDEFTEGHRVQQIVLEPVTEARKQEQCIEEHPLPVEQAVVASVMEEYRAEGTPLEESSEPVGAESLDMGSEAGMQDVPLCEQEMAVVSDLILPETIDVEISSTTLGEQLEIASEAFSGNLEDNANPADVQSTFGGEVLAVDKSDGEIGIEATPAPQVEPSNKETPTEEVSIADILEGDILPEEEPAEFSAAQSLLDHPPMGSPGESISPEQGMSMVEETEVLIGGGTEGAISDSEIHEETVSPAPIPVQEGRGVVQADVGSSTSIPIACETAAAVADSAAALDVADRSTVVTPISVAAETAAAVEDTAALLDATDRSTIVTPIPVAAETAAAVEDTAALLDVADRSTIVTPIPVAAETAAAVEDTASTLDTDTTLYEASAPIPLIVMQDTTEAHNTSESHSKAPTPISVAAETAAAVGDTAALLDRSTTITPVPVDNQTTAAVEDTLVALCIDEVPSEGPTPLPIPTETATIIEDTTTLLEQTVESITFTPIADETVAAVEDTTMAPDIDGIPFEGLIPIPIAPDTVTATQNNAPLEPPQESATITPTPVASPVDVEDNTVVFDIDGTRTKAAPVISGATEAVVEYVEELSIPAESKADAESLEAQGPLYNSLQPVTTDPKVESANIVPDIAETVPLEADVTPTNTVIETSSSLEAEQTDLCQPTELSVSPAPAVGAITTRVDAREEIITSSGKVAPVSQDIVQEQPGAGDHLRDALFTTGTGFAGAALIGGGIYAATREDKTEAVPMTRTITNESSKSVHDKPLTFNGDHIFPHMKEVGPQIAETAVHRAVIVRPTPTLVSKSDEMPVSENSREDRKGMDLTIKGPLIEHTTSDLPHEPEAVSESESGPISKGKEPEGRTPGSFPDALDEEEFATLMETSAPLKAPPMERGLSGASHFSESLISVNAIAEALRYMRENSSDAAIRPPDIVVSEETTDGERTTRNIVEVITPETEITEVESQPNARRDQSRPSTRGSDMVSAKHHRNMMENFWKLVFVGWLGGFGKFFVGLFGRKNGEQLGSVYANYAASMRESQQLLLSQQNLNSEQQRNVNIDRKDKEKVKGGTREGGGDLNGITGTAAGATVLNGGSNGTKSKKGGRSIRKKWNAYRKKGK